MCNLSIPRILGSFLWMVCLCATVDSLSAQPSAAARQPAAYPTIHKKEFIFEKAPFASCHSSTLAETPAGIVAAWFGGSYEGHPDVGIYVSRLLVDQWTKPTLVATGRVSDSTTYACYNPVLFQVPNGDLLLFYKIGPRVVDWTGWMKRSSDGGVSWGEPEPLPDGILGPIKNKPLLLGTTLLCPSSTEREGWKVHIEYTDDLGVTWRKGSDLNDARPLTGIQPALLRHSEQTLQALVRSTNGTINESWSSDNGNTWSALTPTALPNPNSGIDALTLHDGRHLLVYNDVTPPPGAPEGRAGRSPLNVAISSDGKHWENLLVLEDEPDAEFSYPYLIQSADGNVHISYTWKRTHIRYVVVQW